MAPNWNEILLESIAKDRVTQKQPPKAGNELDTDRCAALHNTLTLYGWVCSGKKISELTKRTWWSTHGNEELKRILRPKVVRYLSKIFDVPNFNFFYHVSSTATPKHMLQLAEVLEDEEHDDLKRLEKHRYVILYKTSEALVSQPAGIVFDQQTGLAILMPSYHHLFNFKSPELPWQKLEAILSAYIDMVQGEKAVAIHDEAIIEDSNAPTNKGGDLVQNRSFARYNTRPWILQPYTLRDLHACLDAWSALVKTLEERSGIIKKASNSDDPDYETEDEEPLASRTALTVAGIPRGFAYEILSHARHSDIWFVAPGIRLPKVEEFLQQPFKHIPQQFPEETKGMKVPFLFLRCPGEVTAKQAKFRYPFSTVESVPCGLYLDAFPNAQNPFEDACRLILPIRLGDRRYARTSDGRPLIKSHCDLYQTGINPFVMRHGPKLAAVLENWLGHIESGHWTVNAKGVEGGMSAWREADTRESWWRYQIEHLVV